MIIFDEFETVKYIINNKVSISRYGDGELKLCTGRSAKSQDWNPDIASKLRVILKSNLLKHIVGIPRIYDRNDWPTEAKRDFWNRYSGEKYSTLYNPQKKYHSAFISRPDTNAELDSQEYFDLIKTIWADRNVLLCQGVGVGFNKTGTFFNNAASLQILYGSATNAFSQYKEIYKDIIKATDRYTLIVLALGPTATVLAYDLSFADRQALDLGHLGQYYAHTHPKSKDLKNDWI